MFTKCYPTKVVKGIIWTNADIFHLDHWELISVKFESKHDIFIEESAFGNVISEIGIILSQLQCFNKGTVVQNEITLWAEN